MRKLILFTGVILLLIASVPAVSSFVYLQLIENILNIVRDNYVNPVSIDSLCINAIRGILKDLDPHSVYLTPDEYKDLMIKTEGEFGGIGIQIHKSGDYITIIAPLENTPASRLGLRPGDLIIKIDDVDTKDMNIDDAVKRMRGKPGTEVKLTIKRGDLEPFDLTITREVIKIRAVPFYDVFDGVGYVRLSEFSESASTEIFKALEDLVKKGAKSIILDLRSNPGGLLLESVEVASHFLERDKLVVYTKGRIGEDKYSSFGGDFTNLPLVVLIDGGSASASEIVAGAIQDWDRGLIVGTNSFGKGSVQKVYPLKIGALKLTVALYQTPSGRRIDENMAKEDTAKVFKSLVLKRELKGGGGIKPDTIIQFEKRSDFTEKLLLKNLFFKFTIQYKNKNNAEIKEITDDIMDKFYNFVKNENIEFTDEMWKESYEMNKHQLLITFYENQYGEKGRYRAILSKDKQFEFALNLLKKCKKREDVFKYQRLLKQ
uniref:S41 family peptidase n=1 Tax=candidate division WOR-3 bacterium TaxID=2052148 RepID=A0A7C4Y626_UNCW3